MRKRGVGRNPVDLVAGAVADSGPMRALMAKLRLVLAKARQERIRLICFALLAGMLAADVVLLFRVGDRAGPAVSYSAIRPAMKEGAAKRASSGRKFRMDWNGFLADSVIRCQWDSLLLIRPGLRDTLRQVERMDSAAWGW